MKSITLAVQRTGSSGNEAAILYTDADECEWRVSEALSQTRRLRRDIL